LSPMAAALAERLGLPPGAINVKAKTNEGMGWIGQGQGIAVIAVAALEAR
jgi:2C-methyl-D-erythritol 2,4-cyclodiphosphate synthase